jgi:hypothetical protein
VSEAGDLPPKAAFIAGTRIGANANTKKQVRTQKSSFRFAVFSLVYVFCGVIK